MIALAGCLRLAAGMQPSLLSIERARELGTWGDIGSRGGR